VFCPGWFKNVGLGAAVAFKKAEIFEGEHVGEGVDVMGGSIQGRRGVGSGVHAGGGAVTERDTVGAGINGPSVHPGIEGADDESTNTAGGALIALSLKKISVCIGLQPLLTLPL
jgi:hypothetical protein